MHLHAEDIMLHIAPLKQDIPVFPKQSLQNYQEILDKRFRHNQIAQSWD